MAADSSTPDNYDARGKAYEALPDYPHALDDYNKAFALDSTNPWPLVQIGLIDVHKTHEWDKAWANANQLIKLFPDHPEGWILRLSIEKDQPRVGFHDDGIFFLAHFSQDPNQQAAVREVRQWVAEGKYRSSCGRSSPLCETVLGRRRFVAKISAANLSRGQG